MSDSSTRPMPELPAPAVPRPLTLQGDLPAQADAWRPGRKQLGPRRTAAQMSFWYLTVCVLLAAARAVIPLDVFAAWPSWWMSSLESGPVLVAGVLVLNLSMPSGAVRPWGYIPALVLMAAALFGYDVLRDRLAIWFQSVTDGIDIWALAAIPLYAIRPLVLGTALMVAFTLIWGLSFGAGTRRVPLLYRLLSPFFWIGVAALCIVVAYFHMVNYAQVHDGAVIGLLFSRGAPKSAFWYHLNPLYNLIIYWVATPLELILMGIMVLAPMRMFRRGYPSK